MGLWAGLIAGIGPQTHARLSMADLRAGCAAEGLRAARTVLATGNVLCRSDGDEAAVAAAIARVLVRHAVARAVHVRAARDLPAIAAANPFADAAAERPDRLLVLFCAAPVGPVPAWDGPERVVAAGREAFLDYPEGVGRSRLTGARLERLVGQPGTARNWNTLRRLIAASASS